MSVLTGAPRLKRRELLRTGLALAAPAMAAPFAPPAMPTCPATEIEAHGSAILQMAQELFPTATDVAVRLGARDVDDVEVYAEARTRYWEEDLRLRGGGLWVERLTGSWSSRGGYL